MVLGESEHKQGKKAELGRGGARYGLGFFFFSLLQLCFKCYEIINEEHMIILSPKQQPPRSHASLSSITAH